MSIFTVGSHPYVWVKENGNWYFGRTGERITEGRRIENLERMLRWQVSTSAVPEAEAEKKAVKFESVKIDEMAGMAVKVTSINGSRHVGWEGFQLAIDLLGAERAMSRTWRDKRFDEKERAKKAEQELVFARDDAKRFEADRDAWSKRASELSAELAHLQVADRYKRANLDLVRTVENGVVSSEELWKRLSEDRLDQFLAASKRADEAERERDDIKRRHCNLLERLERVKV